MKLNAISAVYGLFLVISANAMSPIALAAKSDDQPLPHSLQPFPGASYLVNYKGVVVELKQPNAVSDNFDLAPNLSWAEALNVLAGANNYSQYGNLLLDTADGFPAIQRNLNIEMLGNQQLMTGFVFTAAPKQVGLSTTASVDSTLTLDMYSHDGGHQIKSGTYISKKVGQSGYQWLTWSHGGKPFGALVQVNIEPYRAY